MAIELVDRGEIIALAHVRATMNGRKDTPNADDWEYAVRNGRREAQIEVGCDGPVPTGFIALHRSIDGKEFAVRASAIAQVYESSVMNSVNIVTICGNSIAVKESYSEILRKIEDAELEI